MSSIPATAVVSILVFVELALDEWKPALKKFLKHLFQSLFSWNLLLMAGSELR